MKMSKTPPKQQPTNEVLRNARARARSKYMTNKTKANKTLWENADKAVKRQAAGARKKK